MVITRRHGTTQLDNQPCRTSRACVTAYSRWETSRELCAAGSWRLDPQTAEVDAARYQPVTSHLDLAYVQRIDATNLASGPSNYDVTPKHVISVGHHNSVHPSTTGICTEPFKNVTLDPVLKFHPDRPISSALPSSTTSETSSDRSTSSVTSRSSHRPGFLPFSFDLGFKELRVVVIYLIFSMFLICKGCVCSVCSGNTSPRNDRPSYLNVQFNQSKVGYQSANGTCLTMTGSNVDAICNTSSYEEKMRRLNEFNTNFCGLPLHVVLSNQQWRVVSNCTREKCSSVLQEVEQMDAQLSEHFCLFKDVLDRMDCNEVYSYAGTCEVCEVAYKEWLCSIYVARYYDGELVKPCIDVCDRVSENCPFFRPYGETTIGEPGFLCKDPNINQHTAAAALYGPPGCCFHPQHLCDDVTSFNDDVSRACMPTFNVTSNTNCTAVGGVSSGAASSLSFGRFSSPRSLSSSGLLCTYVCLFMLWASRTLSQYSCIGLT